MKKRLEDVQIVIPDTRVLFALAKDDLLHLLFDFADKVNITTNDIVEFEVTRSEALYDAKRIIDYFDKYKDLIHIKSTGFGSMLDMWKANPDITLPNLGADYIYGFANRIMREVQSLPTFIVLEDSWFLSNTIHGSPESVNVKFISLTTFLKQARR
jgi:hypothetical protein